MAAHDLFSPQVIAKGLQVFVFKSNQALNLRNATFVGLEIDLLEVFVGEQVLFEERFTLGIFQQKGFGQLLFRLLLVFWLLEKSP